MDILEAVRRLAEAARAEDAPETDVAGRVLARIRQEQEPSTAPIWVFAVASAAAAGVVACIAAYAWFVWNDPVAALFTQFRMVML